MIDDPISDQQNLIVYDLEYTSWRGFRESGWDMPGKFMEVVQIGAVRVDPDEDWKEVDTFNCYVQPVRNPELSDYFVNLTGITQEMIDTSGYSYSDALKMFTDYVQESDSVLASHGPDHEIIKLNCEFNDIAYPEVFGQAVNLRPWLSESIGVVEGTYTSSELPEVIGKTNDGTAHEALDDARAIISVIKFLKSRSNSDGGTPGPSNNVQPN